MIQVCLEIVRRSVNDVLNGLFPASGEVDIEDLEACEGAKFWFYQQDKEDPDYELSFRGICGILGIDPREILSRLERQIMEREFEGALRAKGLINGQTGLMVKEMQVIASRFLEGEFEKFGQEIQVSVDEDLKVECSIDGREMLCRTLLPGLK